MPYAMTLNISSTRERRDYGSAFVRLDDRSDRHVHSRHANEGSHNDRNNAKRRLKPLASPTIRPISVMVLIVKPEETGATRSSALDQTPSSIQQQHLHPISKPSSKQRRRNPNQIIENRHPNSQHKRSGIHQEYQSHPHPPPENSVRVQVLGAAENSDEDQLARRVGVQATRDQEVGQRDAVRRFLPDGLQGREGASWGRRISETRMKNL
jgi:hypothetical protein